MLAGVGVGGVGLALGKGVDELVWGGGCGLVDWGGGEDRYVGCCLESRGVL